MEREPNYFLIGLVVITLFIGLCLFILWSTKATELDPQITYKIYLKEQSPLGLQKEAQVTMKGLKVGSISDINFNPNNVEEVLVEVDIDADAPVKTDSRAIVRSNFVTGLSYIDLVDSSKGAPLLKNNFSAQDLIIKEGKTTLEEIEQSLPNVLDNATGVLSSLNNFLDQKNSQYVSEILKNSSEILKEVNKEKQQLIQILRSWSLISSELQKVIKSLQPELYQSIFGLKDLLQNTNQEIRTSSKSFQSLTRDLKKSQEKVFGSSDKNLLK